jgi:hypothetical protein
MSVIKEGIGMSCGGKTYGVGVDAVVDAVVAAVVVDAGFVVDADVVVVVVVDVGFVVDADVVVVDAGFVVDVRPSL